MNILDIKIELNKVQLYIQRMNDSYFNYDLPVQTLINKKFKLTPQITKKHKKYYLIRLSLFMKKIWNYEPNIVIIISQIHNDNHSSIIDLFSIDIRRPIRMNACVGNYENIHLNSDYNSGDEEYSLYGCSCESCDIYGFGLLKPYRIKNSKFYERMNITNKVFKVND